MATIVYYPPVAIATTLSQQSVPSDLDLFTSISNSINTAISQSTAELEQVISDAIQNTIVEPLCTWAYETWLRFVDVSFIFCLTVAFVGAICGILGIKRGYKVMIFSIVFYFLLRLFSYVMGWY